MSTPTPISTKAPATRKKVTTLTFVQRVAWLDHHQLTAYYYPPPCNGQGWVDSILVGDFAWDGRARIREHASSTMVRSPHSRAVAREQFRAAYRDMPFLSYQSPWSSHRNAGLFLQHGGRDAVKLEGGPNARMRSVRSRARGFP